MKLKHVLASAVALLCSVATWADTSLLTPEKGWQKLTAIPSNVGDYYYAIVDDGSDLMLTLSRGKNQGVAYNGLYYKTSGNPLADKSMLFTLSAENEYYVMTNVEYNDYFLQTEYKAAHYYRTHDNGGGNRTWGKIKMTYADSKWTIQNGQYYVADGNYLGVWNDNTAPANGQELALNKPSTMKGTYQIYAIAKTDANAYYDALRAGTGATEDNPIDMTALIVNPNSRFWTGSIPYGWETTGTQNINGGAGFDGFPGIFEFSNWGASSWEGSLKQTITVPNGKYILKAALMGGSGVTAYVTANSDKSDNLAHFGDTGGNINVDGTETTMGNGQRGYTYLTVNTKVTNGQIEIGAYATASAEHVWINADNFTLTYLGADLDILKESHANALATAKAVDQSAIMETSVLTALQNTISTYTTVSESTTEAYETAINALTTATTNATNSISAYASTNAYLNKINNYLTGTNTLTNFYTTAAYNTYYQNYKDAYDARTLPTATAATLTADAAYSTGWHAANNLDGIMLSTWKIEDVQCEDYNAALYVNTWSTEGNTDGSEFYAPFYEYWVASGQVLAAKTFTSTIAGLKPSTTYSVTVRARVQPTDNQTKIANAIQMKVGSGEAVTISDGTKFGSTNYYIGNFSAVGETDAEGNLVTTITVAENSNVSWLSFYNVRYNEGEDLSAYIADYEFALNTATANNVNATYANVTGKEKNDLADALETYADEKVDKDSKSALIAATNALSNASNAFVDAKSAYDALAELNTSVAATLSVTLPTVTSATTAAVLGEAVNQAIIAEVTAARAYAFDATGMLRAWTNAPNPNKEQSWDGTADDTYYDEYNKAARAMSQVVTLPVGDYVVIAKGRASENGRLTLSDGTNIVTFPHKGAKGLGIATDGTATYSPEATYANNNNGQGWEYRVLTFTSDGSTPITLTFNWTTASSNWAGLDDIELRSSVDPIEGHKALIAANKGDITSLINGTFDTNAGWEGYTNHVTTLGRNWRGNGINPFIERNADGTMTTTVASMPAGTYKVVAAARSYTGGKLKAQVAGGEYGAELTGTGDAAPVEGTMEINTNGVEMPYSSLGGFTSEPTGHNWHWITATGTLAADGDLVINITTTGNSWMAIDDVHLYCTELDGTSYTRTVGDGKGTINTSDYVVTADIIMNNPNTILRSTGKVTTAAGDMNNNQYNSSRITKLVLYDGYDFTNSGDNFGLDNGATLYRNIPADTWCTLVVPFYPSNLDTKLVPSELSTEGVLTFAPAAEKDMNDAPMLVKSTAGVTAITGSRNSTTGIVKGDMTSGAGAKMNGTYSAISAVSPGSYVVARVGDKDNLYKVDDTVRLAPFRAYFTVPDDAGVKANIITLNLDGTETAIECIDNVQTAKGNDIIYNLAGQRLSKMQKGVNIVNGKKIFVK